MTYRYAMINSGAIVSMFASDRKLPSSEIGVDSSGNPMVLPVVPFSMPSDLDTTLWIVSAPSYTIQGKQVIENFVISPVPNFEEVLLDKIDAKADEMRREFLTPYNTMIMVYAVKKDEASDYLAKGYSATSNPAPAGLYPMLEASIGIDGSDMDQIAMTFVTEAKRFSTNAASIEASRLRIKNEIKAATDDMSKKAAYDTADWAIDINMLKGD